MVLEDAGSGLDEVEPRNLLAMIKGRAAPVTVLGAMALKNVRDMPITFDTTNTLTTQFALSKKAIADLQDIHNIATSKSELMMMWLLEIEKEKNFKDQVVEFCARTTSNSFDNFVSFFSERNIEVRRLNKLVQGRAKAAGYHSAANVDDINKRTNDKVDAEMANFAAILEAALDAGALNADAVAAQAGNNKTAANVADKHPLPTTKTPSLPPSKPSATVSTRWRRATAAAAAAVAAVAEQTRTRAHMPQETNTSPARTAASATRCPTRSAGRWTPTRTTTQPTTSSPRQGLQREIDGEGQWLMFVLCWGGQVERS